MKITIPWMGRKSNQLGRVGIALGPDGTAVAHVDAQNRLDFCQFYPEPSEGHDALPELIQSQDWQGQPCSLVLHPIYYQMTLTEAPAVADEEMTEAVRWRLKEFVDYALDEAAVEFFRLPEDAYRGRRAMLYAAAMRKQSLESLVAPVEQLDLNLDCVEIAELALHNLCHLLPESRGGTAILYMAENESFINLIEDGDIYLSRSIDVGFVQLEGDASRSLESLLLEVQRSLDFYESQIGKGIIASLYYLTSPATTAQLDKYLNQQLGLNIAEFPLTELLASECKPSVMESAVMAIGAAYGPHQAVVENHAAH